MSMLKTTESFHSRNISNARSKMTESVNLRARNSELFDLTDVNVTIVGCGAIGTWTANALARMNVKSFSIYDCDEVGPENIGVQDYTIHQLGQRKVDALKNNLRSINPMTDVHTYHKKIEDDTRWIQVRPNYSRQKRAIIMALDSMSARKNVARIINNLLLDNYRYPENIMVMDARMGSETMQLYTFSPWNYNKYLSTWYSDEEGDSEPCAARSTAYCALMAGSMIASEIKKWVSTKLPAQKVLFNFPSLMIDSETDYSSLIAKK